MPTSSQSPCVLCDSMAQFEHHDGNQTRYYECLKCRQYAITESAVRHLKKHPESKPALAKKAASMPHDIEIIRIFINNTGIIDTEPVLRANYSR